MENKIKKPKFSLVLRTGEGIIIERFFNVRNFNPETIHSLDLTFTCDWIKDSILYHLKKESMKFMWSNYNEYAEPNLNNKVEIKQERKFYLELKYGRTLINIRELDVTLFPKETLENVFLKDEFPKYIQELNDVLAIENKQLTRKYLNQKLYDIPSHIKTDYRKIKTTVNNFKNE